MKHRINWNIFAILLILSLISVVCVFPYVLTIQSEIISKAKIPVNILFIGQFIQSLILFSILIYLGLLFSNKTQLRLPFLEAFFIKNKTSLKEFVTVSLLSGIFIAVAIYLTDELFSIAGVTISTHQNYAPIWQKILAAVYGGITEEIITRLFLMNFFIWISMKLRKQTRASNIEIITAIILAAILFGLGHLPITASVTQINPLVITRAIVLNGIGGIVFGWLFWKKGLESAMLAHFTADIFLLTVLPLLFK